MGDNYQTDRCYILYNADKQEKIGIFLLNQASKLIFGYSATATQKQSIINRARVKSTIHNSVMPFKVAVRYGTKADLEKLGDADMILFNPEYEQYFIRSMGSQDSEFSRIGLAIKSKRKLKQYWDDKRE